MEIDRNRITISGNNITLTNGFRYGKIPIQTTVCVTDRIQQQIEILKQRTDDYEKFNKFIIGLWGEKNIEKEGKQMIESYNLVDLYFNKCKENVEKEVKEKITELKKQSEITTKFIQLVEQFEKDCAELYMSQFNEEEKQTTLLQQDCLDDSIMELRKCDCNNYSYYINDNFKPSGYEKIMNERAKKLNELCNDEKIVKAHLAIAKTKEEVEEILKIYGILDKKGKLVQQ